MIIVTEDPTGQFWLADDATGERLDRGPYSVRKTANREARKLNALAPDPEEEPETVKVPATSLERHTWLEEASKVCRRMITLVDGEVPECVRVTIGWPVGGRGGAHAIGQCFHAEASDDAVREIFISPALSDTVQVFGTLLHEMIHASLPPTAKHGPEFKRLALACGLEGKMTATVESEALRVKITDQLVPRLGAYPAGALNKKLGRKVQGTRLLKCACPDCGYTVRITAKWANIALPDCPVNMVTMELG